MADRRSGKRFIAWAALAGLISGAVFLAVAELFALLVARAASPVLAVGGFVIDIVPQPFKEFAIATFGEYDKIALLAGLISFLSPCVLPLVPGYLGFVAGAVAPQTPADRAPRGRLIGGVLLFIAGFTLVFVGVIVLGGLAVMNLARPPALIQDILR